MVRTENSRLAGLTRIAEEYKESLISVFSLSIREPCAASIEGKFDQLGLDINERPISLREQTVYRKPHRR